MLSPATLLAAELRALASVPVERAVQQAMELAVDQVVAVSGDHASVAVLAQTCPSRQ